MKQAKQMINVLLLSKTATKIGHEANTEAAELCDHPSGSNNDILRVGDVQAVASWTTSPAIPTSIFTEPYRSHRLATLA